MRMSFSFLLLLALTGCPKHDTPDTTVTDPTAVNPKQAFAEGVKLLQAEKADYGGALAKFEAATTADPSYVKAWFNEGYAAEMSGNLDKAITAYKKAVESTRPTPARCST